MPVETMQNQTKKLLFKLREAGPAGLTKGKLGLKAGKGGAARALQELIAEHKVVNLGTATRTCFVLIEHFNPLERACERIEKNALSEKPGRGDLLCDRGRGVERAQSPYVTQEELKALAG